MNKYSITLREHGFSLVELMIVVGILGILMALGLPSYRVWIENTKVRTAAESVLNGLQLARIEAISRNARVQFVLGAASAWTVQCVVETPSCSAADVVSIQSRSEKADGSSSVVSIVSAGAAAAFTTVIFNSMGRMVEPVPTAPRTCVQLDVDTRSLSLSEKRVMRVTVESRGSARLCDPQVDTAGTDPRRCGTVTSPCL